jgi:hypothetical protein
MHTADDDPHQIAEMLMSKDPAQQQAATSRLSDSRALLVKVVHELVLAARGHQIIQALAAAGALFRLDLQFLEAMEPREADPPGLVQLATIGRQALLAVHPSLLRNEVAA